MKLTYQLKHEALLAQDEEVFKPLKLVCICRLRESLRIAECPQAACSHPVDSRFIEFLCNFLNIGRSQPGQADTIGAALERYLALEGTYDKLSWLN